MPELLRVGEADLAPLVRRAGRLAAAGGRRLLGLTGAPGVGKSTVAEALVAGLGRAAELDSVGLGVPGGLAEAAVLVPMDGFHLASAQLHRLGRDQRKGAPDTFDAAGYVALLQRLCQPVAGETVWAPRFDRGLEEPIAAAIAVPPEVRLVVTEGNYLLLEAGGWAPVRDLLDEIWYLERDEATRLARLTARHVAYGRSPADAAARAEYGSDQRNAELIASTRNRADLLIQFR